MPSSTSARRQPSVGGLLLHEPQLHRLRRGHEPGPDRRHPRPRSQWSANNVKRALRAEAIVARLDPGRIVYHHSSGNLELDAHEQLLHQHGPGPGTRRLVRALGHPGRQADVHLRVHGALHLGLDDVSRLVQGRAGPSAAPRCPGNSASPSGVRSSSATGPTRSARRRRRTSAGRPSSSAPAGSGIAGIIPTRSARRSSTNQHAIIGTYLADNWRAFRTWGVSAISPWEHDFFWSLRKGVDKSRKQLKVDWENLQRPGFSPDYIGEQYERMDMAYERSDWIPTADGQAILRNNMPLLAYIAGKPAAFTSKDHNFIPARRSRSSSSSSTTPARR